MTGVDGCLACDLSAGRVPLLGGRIHETRHWLVEHCVGPLGVGTLVVKPTRHVEHVADLGLDETAELGPLLQRTSDVVTLLCAPEQVYVCLWSHAGRLPVHLHFVVQPVTEAVMAEYGGAGLGPALQSAMFGWGAPLPADAVEEFADAARQAFADPELTSRLAG